LDCRPCSHDAGLVSRRWLAPLEIHPILLKVIPQAVNSGREGQP
jgi:hypothetical protein